MTHCPDVTLRCRHDNSLNGLCRTKRKCSCGHVAKGPYDCVRRRWSVAVGLSARSPISRATVLRPRRRRHRPWRRAFAQPLDSERRGRDARDSVGLLSASRRLPKQRSWSSWQTVLADFTTRWQLPQSGRRLTGWSRDAWWRHRQGRVGARWVRRTDCDGRTRRSVLRRKPTVRGRRCSEALPTCEDPFFLFALAICRSCLAPYDVEGSVSSNRSSVTSAGSLSSGCASARSVHSPS